MRRTASHWSKSENAKLVFFLAALVLVGLVFTVTPTLFPSALLSILLFFVFSPLIDSLESRGIQRSTAILSLFLLFGVVITVAMTLVAPRIAGEVAAFQAGQSKISSEFSTRLAAQQDQLLGKGSLGALAKRAQMTEKFLSWLQKSLDKLWNYVPDFASNFFAALLLVPFFTFVLLKDSHEIRRGVLRLVPNRYFETVYSIVSRILEQMGGFVAARILEAFLVGLLVTVGCWIANVPYAILLGIFAGATNAIPYLGPVLGAVPGLVLAILEPAVPNQLLWVLVIYAIANVIDMVVIFPVVVAKIVDLHPVVVVVSVILGSQLFGIVGMLVAVPVTSILKILLSELYARLYDGSDPA